MIKVYDLYFTKFVKNFRAKKNDGFIKKLAHDLFPILPDVAEIADNRIVFVIRHVTDVHTERDAKEKFAKHGFVMKKKFVKTVKPPGYIGAPMAKTPPFFKPSHPFFSKNSAPFKQRKKRKKR